MSEAQYGEPWEIERVSVGDITLTWVNSQDCIRIISDVDEDDGARLVACVNGCQGVPHPERLPELLAAIRQPEGTCEDVVRAITAAHAALYEE